MPDSKIQITRTPPSHVRRQLRAEVGFGCPISGCRSPLLTWHHFNPPWNVENHNRPAGMIALCQEHHRAADAGVYTKTELQSLKAASYEEESVRTHFPFTKQNFLIRLGGNYMGGTRVPITFGGEPVVQLNRGSNGLLLLSMWLRDAAGNLIVEIEDNDLMADPDKIHDLQVNTSATNLKLWLAKRSIGLELEFSRITVEELSERLAIDGAKSERNEVEIPQEILSNIPESLRRTIAPPSGDDMIARFVKQWVLDNCLDDEDRIPFINFKRFIIQGPSRTVEIKDGVFVNGKRSITYCASFDNGTGISL